MGTGEYFADLWNWGNSSTNYTTMNRFEKARKELTDLVDYQTVGQDTSLSEEDFNSLGGLGAAVDVEILDVQKVIFNESTKGLKWKLILFPCILTNQDTSVETTIRAISDEQAFKILDALETLGSNVETSGVLDKPYSTKAAPEILKYGASLTTKVSVPEQTKKKNTV